MKYEELTIPERANIMKYIKESLLGTQTKVKLPINPNEFDYNYSRGGLQIKGRLSKMNNNQIKSKIIRSLKSQIK